MNVRLINFTTHAAMLLIYTKQTRLTFGQDAREKVSRMSEEEQAAELKYIAGTIPSSWEFVDYVFEITGVSRGFTHQFVRTRTNSYAQQTMRVLDVTGFEFVTGPTIANDPQRQAIYNTIMSWINEKYQQLIACGAAVEDARGCLPTNICTNIIVKMNLRTLSDMCRSRTGLRTQSEYRDVVMEIKRLVLEQHPWAVDFLEPQGLKVIETLQCQIGSMALQPHIAKMLDTLRKLV